MSDQLERAVRGICSRFDAEPQEFRGETTLTIPAAAVVDVLTTLRDEHGFDMLVDLTAVDYWPQQAPRFHIIYQMTSIKTSQMLRLRAPLDGNAPVIATVTGVFPNANWYEREVWDLFGVRFEGHPDPRRIVMPADWEGHPLRKDYPLGYEEVQFTFNYKDIDVKKIYPAS